MIELIIEIYLYINYNKFRHDSLVVGQDKIIRISKFLGF